jgi:hypothetical protein
VEQNLCYEPQWQNPGLLVNTVANYVAKSSIGRVRMPPKRANRCQMREIKWDLGVSGSIFIVSARYRRARNDGVSKSV